MDVPCTFDEWIPILDFYIQGLLINHMHFQGLKWMLLEKHLKQVLNLQILL
jgi:hypothetical protein